MTHSFHGCALLFHDGISHPIVIGKQDVSATCGAIKALVLSREAIAIRASAPSKAHIRAYMTTVDGKPSGTQAPPLEEDGEPHSPAKNSHAGGVTLHNLQADLGDLTDQELHQLLEDLCWEVTLCELNAHPSSPPLMPWENLTGNRDLDADDQEVTFLRGRAGSPGTALPTSGSHTAILRMGSTGTTSSRGSPGKTIPISCSLMARWSMGSTGTTSSTPDSCSA